MIKLENFEVVGWEHVIRGMRNPMNSWDKSDSFWGYHPCGECNGNSSCIDDFKIGVNDRELMLKLAKGGSVHAKYRRMITVYVDITAPLYWWKEFDTYKVGTVANSCSTMHKIHAKEFVLKDFSTEHLSDEPVPTTIMSPRQFLTLIIGVLNTCRGMYLDTKDKAWWWQMIQLLPSSYNQKRTIMMNYEVLTGIYRYRKDHKLDEWREFCSWIEYLPYSDIITCNVGGESH